MEDDMLQYEKRDAFLCSVLKGICPVCGKEMTSQRERAYITYAMPCEDRLWEGSILTLEGYQRWREKVWLDVLREVSDGTVI